MILEEGYIKDGVWIPEITDDPRENAALVVRSLVTAEAISNADESNWLARCYHDDDELDLQSDLADEVAEAHVGGMIGDAMNGRLTDMLDGLS